MNGCSDFGRYKQPLSSVNRSQINVSEHQAMEHDNHTETRAVPGFRFGPQHVPRRSPELRSCLSRRDRLEGNQRSSVSDSRSRIIKSVRFDENVETIPDITEFKFINSHKLEGSQTRAAPKTVTFDESTQTLSYTIGTQPTKSHGPATVAPVKIEGQSSSEWSGFYANSQKKDERGLQCKLERGRHYSCVSIAVERERQRKAASAAAARYYNKVNGAPPSENHSTEPTTTPMRMVPAATTLRATIRAPRQRQSLNCLYHRTIEQLIKTAESFAAFLWTDETIAGNRQMLERGNQLEASFNKARLLIEEYVASLVGIINGNVEALKDMPVKRDMESYASLCEIEKLSKFVKNFEREARQLLEG